MNPRLPLFFFVSSLVFAGLHAADNTLTSAERKAGWQLLFDGKTLNGWKPYANRPAGGWEVVDGMMHAIGKAQLPKDVKGSELVTVKKFKDFELSWDWKVPVAGNNGIKYFISETRTKSPGPEYQMLDDDGHPDGKIGGRLHQTAAFYDVLEPAADKPKHAPGEWNSSRIIAKGQHVEHWLNGVKVLEFELDSPEVKAGIAKSKFKKDVGFGEHIEGPIMLTYHQDDCWFKNIKIREL